MTNIVRHRHRPVVLSWEEKGYERATCFLWKERKGALDLERACPSKQDEACNPIHVYLEVKAIHFNKAYFCLKDQAAIVVSEGRKAQISHLSTEVHHKCVSNHILGARTSKTSHPHI